MPLTTTIAVTTLLTTLAQKGLEKSFETGAEKVTEGALNWLKSLFFKGDLPKKAFRELQLDPENTDKLNNAKSIIDNSIEDNPEYEFFLKEILEKTIKNDITITNSKNVNTGNINSGGGSVQLGDNYGK